MTSRFPRVFLNFNTGVKVFVRYKQGNELWVSELIVVAYVTDVA